MKKIIVVLMTMVIASSFFVGCKSLNKVGEKVDRDSDVVSNVQSTKAKEYTDRNNAQIVDDEKFSIAITGTIYDLSSKRSLILKVENKTNREISVKIQSATIDGNKTEAIFTNDKIKTKESVSKAIIFKEKTDFKESSGDIIVFDSNTGDVLGTYKYNVQIVEKK